MTELLQRAFTEAKQLSQEEQDWLARFILAELESEQRWAELFARPESDAFLARMAEEIRAEHRARHELKEKNAHAR